MATTRDAMSSATPDVRALRGAIDAHLERGEVGPARARLAALWAADPTSATAGFVVGRCERLRAAHAFIPCKMHVLRSFTLEPMVPLLRAAAFVANIDVTVRFGEFNAITQEILDPSSELYRGEPRVIVIAAQARDVSPSLFHRFADLSAAEVEAEVRDASARMAAWIAGIRERSQASILVHALEAPDAPSMGLLDGVDEPSQSGAIAAVNAALRAAARGHRGVYVVDVARVVARRGSDRFRDEKKWLTARMPIAAGELVHLAREWLRYVHPLVGRVAKALVCDLDNTLWGGVIGEDGIDGIRLGQEHPGAAYLDLQRAVLDVSRRGILLAVASKNNRADALEAIERHPSMLLRKDHFAAMRIDWTDKAESLRAIAEELNIGVDALAFLDDNPVERERIRTELPDVAVIELPEDPMGYARAVRDSPFFERLSLVKEDRERGRYYVEQRLRTELETSSRSIEDFYRSLEQVATIGPVTPATRARVAQLTQKTNQFNVTTRRYTEQEIDALSASPDVEVCTLHVRDRYGDNGLVGVAILRHGAASTVSGASEIDTFLMSCRVIGRTVETAFLAWLAGRAKARGARELVGRFVPTKKNAPARSFFPSHGFVLAGSAAPGDGDAERETEHRLDLDSGVAWPPWIVIEAPASAAETAASKPASSSESAPAAAPEPTTEAERPRP